MPPAVSAASAFLMFAVSVLPLVSLLGRTWTTFCVEASAGCARPSVAPATAARPATPPVSTVRRAVLGRSRDSVVFRALTAPPCRRAPGGQPPCRRAPGGQPPCRRHAAGRPGQDHSGSDNAELALARAIPSVAIIPTNPAILVQPLLASGCRPFAATLW